MPHWGTSSEFQRGDFKFKTRHYFILHVFLRHTLLIQGTSSSIFKRTKNEFNIMSMTSPQKRKSPVISNEIWHDMTYEFIELSWGDIWVVMACGMCLHDMTDKCCDCFLISGTHHRFPCMSRPPLVRIHRERINPSLHMIFVYHLPCVTLLSYHRIAFRYNWTIKNIYS